MTADGVEIFHAVAQTLTAPGVEWAAAQGEPTLGRGVTPTALRGHVPERVPPKVVRGPSLGESPR